VIELTFLVATTLHILPQAQELVILIFAILKLLRAEMGTGLIGYGFPERKRSLPVLVFFRKPRRRDQSFSLFELIIKYRHLLLEVGAVLGGHIHGVERGDHAIVSVC
jgi:hypothetical protein